VIDAQMVGSVEALMEDKINLAEKLKTFSEHWSPRTVAQLNQFDVMVVKVMCEFVWHKHDETDDFFSRLEGHIGDSDARPHCDSWSRRDVHRSPRCRTLLESLRGSASVAD
jgi:hypothetical protein